MAKKILITEDSPTVLEILKVSLQEAGYEVVAALDGQEALLKSQQERPDLIILDLMLPKIDGFKVCAMIKHNTNLKNIPVIILTARSGEQDIKTGKEVSADFYMTKPVDPDALIMKVRELLKGCN